MCVYVSLEYHRVLTVIIIKKLLPYLLDYLLRDVVGLHHVFDSYYCFIISFLIQPMAAINQ